MSSEGVNKNRRRFLTGTVSVVGAIGAVGVAIPFVKMWQPSARARAAGAPVEVTIDKLEPGQMLKAEWRGRPVWILRRTDEMLATLDLVEDQLRDPNSEAQDQQPDFAENQYRSLNPEYLVLLGICTHLGCSPKFVPEVEPQPFDPDWKGGFFCPCHNSRFDLAGRVYQGVPAPLNLEVPPYSFLDDNRLLIGIGPEGAA
ncbi:MAG: ubiquinol-cytochrome c reductase iron-sulfur subunit [Xanthomonadales bacterium]|nr:ubiquinol-cytochrome c reductase iron-sulfur subunit [Xanthomonadales bacterium]